MDTDDDAPQAVGRYAIYDQIAAGAMATVHFGRLIGTAGFSRTVAVKRLHRELVGDPEFQATLIDEARLAARIHHPNVVPTLDVVSAEGELLVVMEYVRGESLARLVRGEHARGRRVPPAITSAIMVGALSGLHAAHEATSDRGEPLGLVHRDVSPQNILVGIDGMPRVIDFGVAKAAGRLQTTAAGVIKGKLAYMAPEQLAGKPVGRTVDVYAAAVVLWEALAGARLFAADGDGAIARRVFAGASEPPSSRAADVTPAVDAVVMRGLSLEPGARFATAREMAQALQLAQPPAFASDVGEWCMDLAREALEKRSTLLAQIESRSGAGRVAVGWIAGDRSGSRPPPPVQPSRTPPPLAPAAAQAHDDGSVEVEVGAASGSFERRVDAGSRPAFDWRSNTTIVASAIVGGLAILGLGAALLARGARSPSEAVTDASAAAVESSAPSASAAATTSAAPPLPATPSADVPAEPAAPSTATGHLGPPPTRAWAPPVKRPPGRPPAPGPR